MNDETDGRAADLERRLHDLQLAYQELEQKNKMLEALALTDPLTGLANRRAMDHLAERELRRRDRYPAPLAVLRIDVDGFKGINNRYLMPGGDKALADLARVMNSTVRGTDYVGRYGGDDFMVVSPQTDWRGATVLAERIRSAVEGATFAYKDDVIPMRVSVGGAIAAASDETDWTSLHQWASAALDEAKRTGRNRCVLMMARPVRACLR